MYRKRGKKCTQHVSIKNPYHNWLCRDFFWKVNSKNVEFIRYSFRDNLALPIIQRNDRLASFFFFLFFFDCRLRIYGTSERCRNKKRRWISTPHSTRIAQGIRPGTAEWAETSCAQQSRDTQNWHGNLKMQRGKKYIFIYRPSFFFFFLRNKRENFSQKALRTIGNWWKTASPPPYL